jgi:hypothetical protein
MIELDHLYASRAGDAGSTATVVQLLVVTASPILAGQSRVIAN